MLQRKAPRIYAKQVNYVQNGTGRDVYINKSVVNRPVNQPKPFEFRLELPKPKNFQPIPKTVHYHANGAGRDLYVMFA